MKEKSLSERIVQNSFYNFITTIFGRAGALIFTIILARILLPELFGIYSLAISVVSFLSVIIDVGINSAMLKYTPKEVGKEKVPNYFIYLFKLKLTLVLGIAILIAILSYPISIFIFNKPALIMPMLFSGIYLIVISMDSFFTSLFFVVDNVKIVFWKEILFQTLRIISIILIPLLLVKNFYVVGVIISLIITTFVGLLFTFFIAKHKYKYLFQKDSQIINKKEIKNFIFYVTIGGLSAMFFSYIDIFMLGSFISDASYAGYYRAATTLVFSIAGILTFTNVLLPKFSQIKQEDLQNPVDKVIRFALALSIPATAGLLILGRYIIRLVYGYEYLNATYPLYFLSILIAESVLSGLLYAILSAKGKPEIYTKAATITLILNVVLNYLFITTLLKKSFVLAMTGAAIATLISRMIYLSMLTISIKRNFNIIIKPVFIIKPIMASIVMASILLTINHFVVHMTLILGGFEILFGATVYFIMLFLLKGITKEDIKLMNPRKII